jgi:hypothetical protein
VAEQARNDFERVHGAVVDRVHEPSAPGWRRWLAAASVAVAVTLAAVFVNRTVNTDTGRDIIVFLSGFILFATALVLLGKRRTSSVIAVLGGAAAFSAVVFLVLSATDTGRSATSSTVEPTPPGITACPATERAGRYALPIQTAVEARRGAAVRAAPALNAEVLKRYPPGCKLQFDGYCLGEPASDVASNTPDIIWNRRANEPGYVASATVDGFAPPQLRPTSCPRGQPGPRRVSLKVHRSHSQRLTAIADAPAAPLVGFAKFSHGRWQAVRLDVDASDGWKATFDSGTTVDLVGAFACWAAGARAHPNGPNDVVGATRSLASRKTSVQVEARRRVVEAGNAACEPEGLSP